jgi:hypothetical protein
MAYIAHLKISGATPPSSQWESDLVPDFSIFSSLIHDFIFTFFTMKSKDKNVINDDPMQIEHRTKYPRGSTQRTTIVLAAK